MHKNTTKCNETQGKWCKNKHGASKIIDTFVTYQRQRNSTVLTAKRPSTAPHLEKSPGLQTPSNRWDDGDTTAGAEKGAEAPARSSRSRSSNRSEIDWATLGGDGDEQRRNQRITAIKWKSLTRRSKCPTWRWRSSPELVGIERRSHRRFEIAREERIRVRASEWDRVRGRPTGPGWSSLARWGWPDQWAQAVSLLFLIAKILEKNPNVVKTNPEKYLKITKNKN
jgi:hypothetical protein